MAVGQFEIRQFRQDDCLSYIVSDLPSRQAMVVDPRLDLMDEYRSYLGEVGCRLVYSIDTRTHSDHLSGSRAFSREQDCVVLPLSRPLADREKLKLGSGDFQVMSAPGSCSEQVVLVFPDWILTGDALWIGSLANAELAGADPARLLATAQRIVKELPGKLLVYPGHDRMGLLFSTLDVEKKRNPLLGYSSAEDLVSHLDPHRPVRLDADSVERAKLNSAPLDRQSGSIDANQVRSGTYGKPRSAPDEWGASQISVEKFRKKLEEHAMGMEFIDVREKNEFQSGHMPGMRNVPVSNLGVELPQLMAARRVYLSCLTGMRSSIVARTLAYLGLPDVVLVSGGLKAWNQAGFKVTEKEVD